MILEIKDKTTTQNHFGYQISKTVNANIRYWLLLMEMNLLTLHLEVGMGKIFRQDTQILDLIFPLLRICPLKNTYGCAIFFNSKGKVKNNA